MRKQSLHSIRRALEHRKGKYAAEDNAWLFILGSLIKDFDDTVFFNRFPKVIQKALEHRKGKYAAEDNAWLFILGSLIKDFDDTVFFNRFPKAIQKASEIRDKVGSRQVALDENDFSDPIRRARKQFFDARVSSLGRESLHARCVEPIEADVGSTNGKDQEAPTEK